MSPASESSGTETFDAFVESYEEACARGLSLSGESRDFFAQQRVAHTKRLCAGAPRAGRVVDFGCGLGHSTPYLADAFPGARITGVDSSEGALQAARREYGAVAEFTTADAGILSRSVDVVYSNGTFHHIEPRDRHDEVRRIADWLAPGGLFALWENNPWNPGTRLVMKRIPFDRDAKTLSQPTAARLLRGAGLRVLDARSYFYFPSWLKPLRRLESRLERLPLGAQYCVLAQRPASR
jgi:trans-aconitate methyltransferase